MLYPIVNQARNMIDLCGTWDFKLDTGEGFSHKWYEKRLENPDTMVVPASYNDMKEKQEYRDHYGWVFYQREVQIPKVLEGQRIVLRFGSVTHGAIVYWNGTEICSHKGGFLPFEVEIEGYAADSNLLTVAVDNRINLSTLPVGSEEDKKSNMFGMAQGNAKKKKNNPNFDFFNYAGIARPVKIYTTPKEYIKDISIVTQLQDGVAVLTYEVQVSGSRETAVYVYDKQKNLVAKSEGNQGILQIQDPILWQPLKPYLYNIVVTSGDDRYDLPYGIRTVEVRGAQFLINGKPFYFKGYGKHEDTFPAGRGLNMPMNAKDISLMKWQGANSFRTSHYPYSEEMMRLCDEEGIVVIDETPAVGLHLNFGGGANFKNGEKIDTFDLEKGVQTKEHHMDVIRDMIARDKNHACVVMWSIANEPDSTSPLAYDYFKPLFDLAREVDPQKRPCTLVSVQTSTPEKDCSLQLSDVICLNRYYGWYVHGDDFEAAEEAFQKELKYWQESGKPFMMTEYGADTVMGLHDTVPVMYTEEFQVEYYKMNHRVMDQYSHLIGEQVWNFADFATWQGILRVQGNKKGIFTRERRPKYVAHYLRDRWTSIPDFAYKRGE